MTKVRAANIFEIFGNILTLSGQFWPGFEMARTGLSRYFMLKENISWEGSFTVSQKTLVDKPNTHSHCIQVKNNKSSVSICFNGNFRTQIIVFKIVYSPGLQKPPDVIWTGFPLLMITLLLVLKTQKF